MLTGMGRLRELDRAAERRWPRMLNPTTPLATIYSALGLLVMSFALSIYDDHGLSRVATASAIGLLSSAAIQIGVVAEGADREPTSRQPIDG
jgi:hypothetical protein